MAVGSQILQFVIVQFIVLEFFFQERDEKRVAKMRNPVFESSLWIAGCSAQKLGVKSFLVVFFCLVGNKDSARNVFTLSSAEL